jgi:hypothetical protein
MLQTLIAVKVTTGVLAVKAKTNPYAMAHRAKYKCADVCLGKVFRIK